MTGWIGATSALALVAGLLVGARLWLMRAFRITDRAPVDDPARLGLACETTRLPTRNGKRLLAHLFFPHPGAPVIVIVHGWGAGGSHMLFMVPPLVRAGYNVVVFDARCHGGSDDDGFASLPRFAEDTAAVLAHLRQRPDLGPIVLLGHSVGAGAVLLAAARDPGVRATISLSAFSHPAPIMTAWMDGMGIPRRPLGLPLDRIINRLTELFIGHRFDAIAPATSIRRIQGAVLLVHGDRDRTVPLWHAEALARARPDAPLVVIPGLGHDDRAVFEAHVPRLLSWLAEVLGPQAPADGRPSPPAPAAAP